MRNLIEIAESGASIKIQTNAPLTTNMLQQAIKHAELYLKEVRSNGISARRASSIAKELEDSIYESSYGKIFLIEDPQSRELLQQLQDDTAQHAIKVQAMSVQRDQYSLLVERKLISHMQVELARSIAKTEGLSVEEILIGRFNVSKEDVIDSLAKFSRTSALEPGSKVKISPELGSVIREHYEIMKNRLFCPIERSDKKMVLLMSAPYDLVLRDEIALKFSDYRLEFRAALPEDILNCLDSIIPQTRNKQDVSELLDQLTRDVTAEGDERSMSEVKEEDSSIIKLANMIIEQAYVQGASDIHIEPDGTSPLIIRFRIDGDMRRIMECPHQYRRALIARLKIMSGLDISERRKPQSGKIRFRRWGRLDLELRLETYPTATGDEDAVLRLLTPGKVKMLSEIGLSRRNQAQMESLLRKPFGLFLCVGATGSGKTTTLHSALSLLNDGTLKIVTAEDPVEITQPGVRQMQVKPKIGLDFAEALRSFLRADPDVIMIGEIRDSETAGTAVEASLTGHLVLSTLHTNTAPETISRLLDLGVNPFTFSDALLGIVAQRLIRRLCDQCRKPRTDKEIMEIMEKEYSNRGEFQKIIQEKTPTIYAHNNEPCSQCNGSGYKGRLAIHELLAVTPTLQDMIVKKASANQLREKAIEAGMRTFRQDGIEKVLAGETTLEEVFSAAIH